MVLLANMTYKLTEQKDEFLDKIFKDSIDDLNKFYEIKWVYNLPKIITVDDRKTINLLRGEQTENWLIGWSEGSIIFILDRNSLEAESDHKYNPDHYFAFIKHELSHCFFNMLTNYHRSPIWLNDGVAIYTSGQNNEKRKPEKFTKFLEFYDKGGKELYSEPGFFIEGLVKKFGKQKLLNFIKEQSQLKTKEEFEKLFAKTYGFNLNYDEINAQEFI